MTRHNTKPTKLTDDEVDALHDWWDEETTVSASSVLPVVARIKADAYNAGLAARGNNTTHETRAAAVLDEWEAEPSMPPQVYNLIDDLRAALSPAPTNDHTPAASEGETNP